MFIVAKYAYPDLNFSNKLTTTLYIFYVGILTLLIYDSFIFTKHDQIALKNIEKTLPLSTVRSVISHIPELYEKEKF